MNGETLGNVDQQQVWGVSYIDELVQEGVNSNPAGQSTCDRLYWACQDANYNVNLLVDSTGVKVERYAYTPYGVRTVYKASDAGDAQLTLAIGSSQAVMVGSVAQPYGLCEFGHQGLQHDEESGLIYNRARMLHPTLGRFMQRDPLGYVDGMSVYQYEGAMPLSKLDPSGNWYIGIGIGGSVTAMVPVAGATSLGLSGSGSTTMFWGRDAAGSFCEVCDSVGLTVMWGAGAAVNVSAGPVVAFGPGRPGSGPSVTVGVGAGVPITGAADLEITVDVDTTTGMTTISIPKVGVGLTAYAALRVTGSCSGCTPGLGSLVLGKPARQAAITSCMKSVQTALTQALTRLNGLVVPTGGATVRIPGSPMTTPAPSRH